LRRMKSKQYREMDFGLKNFRKGICFPEVDSTNLTLMELVENVDNSKDVVIAGKQIGGRGRRDNVWWSPPGGLWMSARIPDCNFGKYISVLNILCGLSCAKACNTVLAETNEKRLRTSLRWPNDIMLLDRKLGGLLIEVKTVGNSFKSIIVGVGINVNQRDFPEGLEQSAISLAIVLQKRSSRYKLVIQILKELDSMIMQYKEEGTEDLAREWRAFSYELGKEVEIKSSSGKDKYGKVIGIGKSGELLLIDNNNSVQRVFEGFNLKILDK